MGRPRGSPLAPLLRSDAQARVLATVILSPETLHVRAIADRTNVPYSVVQREIDRLEEAGLMTSTRFATSRIVRLNQEHPLFSELRALLLKAYGPREVLAELLAHEERVEGAYIYGSWAARYNGEWGSPPADIDVILIGDPPMDRVDELEAEAEDLLGQPVQITVVPRSEWDEPRAAFTRTVKGRALVPIREKEDR